MSSDLPISPAFLRTLLFAGVIEGVLYRLLPPPVLHPITWAERVHAALHRGGGFMFFVAYALALACLVDLSWKALRDRRWPAGLNGAVSVGCLCLAMLGVTAVTAPVGPSFALGFTALSVLLVLLFAMHAFSMPVSPAARALFVTWTAAVICSACSVGAEALAQTGSLTPSWLHTLDAALPAGEALIAAAGACAFLALFEPGAAGRWAGLLPAALGAVAFAAGSLLPSPRWALIDVHPMRLALLSAALFLAAVTGLSCLADPRRRPPGLGLVVLLLAGYPLRIAHQQMLAVIGTALLMAPPLRRDLPAAEHLRPRDDRDNVVVLYARAPVLGQVKTRLQPELTAEQALRLHEAMLADTLERLRAACEGVATLCVSWSGEPPQAGEVAHLARGLRWELQGSGTLGDRMGATFTACSRAGFRRAVLIGSDAPHLPPSRAREAFEALAEAEVVIGPTQDGGYYLLGARRAPVPLLHDMPWGTSALLTLTRRRLEEAGLTHRELPYDFDLDTPDDARRLLTELRFRRDRGEADVSPRTLAVLEEIFPSGGDQPAG